MELAHILVYSCELPKHDWLFVLLHRILTVTYIIDLMIVSSAPGRRLTVNLWITYQLFVI